MTVRERINRCILIEKIEKQEKYSNDIGVVNVSKFKGKSINPQKNNKQLTK